MTTPTDPVQTALDAYGAVGTWAQSNPEIKTLFDTAVAQGWDATRFERELWGTQWWQQNQQNVRNLQVLQATDPATYNAQMSQKAAEITQTAFGLGLNPGSADVNYLALSALQNNWSDAVLREHMVDWFKPATQNGQALGTLGDYENTIRSTFNSYGVKMSDDFYQWNAQQVAAGRATTQGLANEAIGYATTLYPQYADQFKSGKTLSDIATPYIQQMGQILETDPTAIDIYDPTIQKALQGNGQAPTSMWDFQQQLKQDPRWGTTQNAKNAAADVVAKIGQDWGFLK